MGALEAGSGAAVDGSVMEAVSGSAPVAGACGVVDFALGELSEGAGFSPAAGDVVAGDEVVAEGGVSRNFPSILGGDGLREPSGGSECSVADVAAERRADEGLFAGGDGLGDLSGATRFFGISVGDAVASD